MKIIQFGPFKLQGTPLRLYKGEQAVECDAKVLELLHLLAGSPGDILDRNRILETIWPDRVVSDASLAQLVHRARQVLDDTGKDPQYIRTVRSRGLQWVAPTETTEPPPATPEHSQRTRLQWHWLAAALALALALWWVYPRPPENNTPSAEKTTTENSEKLALLPVQYPEASVQYRWVPLGLMEMVAEMMTGTPGLDMVPSRKVVAWLDAHPEIRQPEELAKTMCPQLGCTRLLVATASGSPIPDQLEYHWVARNYKSPPTRLKGKDLLQLAHRMAADILQPYRRSQGPTPEIVAFSGNNQANQAYALALQAKHEGQLDLARQYLQIAVGQEPGFAMAMAHLSHVEEQLSELTLAEQHARQVLDMTSPPWQAHYLALKTLSNIQYSRGDLEASMATTQDMLQRNWPLSATEKGNLSLNTGTTLQRLNRAEEARAWLHRAEELYDQDDYPLGQAMSWLNLGNVDLGENRYQAAMQWYRKAVDAFQNLGHQQYALIARFQLAVVYKNLTYFDQAIQLFQQMEEESRAMKDTEGALLARVERLDSRNRQASAPALLIQQLPELISEAESQQLAYPAHLARNLLAHALWQQNQPEKALLWLQWQSPLGQSDYNTRMMHALLLWRTGQLDAAMEEADAARELAGEGWPENFSHWRQAMTLAKARQLDYEQATADLKLPAISP